MKDFFKKYCIDPLTHMAQGLFATLIVGSILNQIGVVINHPVITPFLCDTVFPACKVMTAPVIAMAVSYGLKSDPLVIFTCGAAGYIGSDPVSALLAGIAGNVVGMLVSKKTKLDILLTPIVTLISAGVVAALVGPVISQFMNELGQLIMWATEQQPFVMGILVSVIMGMILTLPISSAALCMMLNLSGIAAGAATVGCCCQMVGFAVMSYKVNGFGGLLAQGLGTSMLQVPNIMKKPIIWLPTILSSAVLGPVCTVMLKMTNLPYGAGMGTSGLVGQFGTFEAMGATPVIFVMVLVIHFILPAVLTSAFSSFMKKNGWIKDSDLKLDI